ncbi:Transient receptor potential channel pyrexia [Orchesella cincta]|uniref:Transient receptor potential channel pyrexia n=1 Tax=Orchesella cincta TaxID=48709 RepID=A0A1D2MGT5_ORCCI|nr:Transient receptor potential channel pyrexia [Orchesella cincta]
MQKLEEKGGFYLPEMNWLSRCLSVSHQNQKKILMHPVVQVFLLLKWKKISALLWLSILYHIIWLMLYTYFNVDVYLIHCPFRFHKDNRTTSHDNTNQELIASCDVRNHYTHLSALLWLLYTITVSIVFKEIYEISTSNNVTQYFLKLENIGQWILAGIVFLTSVPVFQVDNSYEVQIYDWQYQASSFGILLACFLILNQIGKIPSFGRYVLILATVIRSFSMFMVTFASILIAFMLSFHILMPEKDEFSDFPWNFVKILVMMTGEINHDDVFHSKLGNLQLPFPISTKLLFAIFVALVTIVLFNLLIGLTVSDIQGLQTGARLSSLSVQVEEMHLMEAFLLSDRVQRLLKALGKHGLLQYFLVNGLDFENGKMKMDVDVRIDEIPKHLHDDIRRLSKNFYSETDDNEYDECDGGTEESEDEINLKDFSISCIQNAIKLNNKLNVVLDKH